ncbi:tetraacyldisaccharide 4'-kinase [Dyella sp. BiH032]|uniref:tetraacyldisaccharide 4'-kinase n=1 Tax=Dyella sp. BiH032 TaxID=3075430 RepID=UPI00289352D8|nr:tetraacyldisaccharide 4'-kinase [Dyella sp. BiH032]WNL47957.1 tetraacyldisaccharide 4'-kinase [Dyella sp. BiH032]
MALADTLEAAWYGKGTAPWWTVPLSWLYGGVVRLRRRLYRRGWLRSVQLPVPVLVVGNITVGGTGKTPLTIALAEALRARGFRPGVVSRGYGGTEQGPALLDERPDPARFGDEPCLIRAAGTPVAVGRDRPAASRLLVEAGCDVVIADDGLQHYRLRRDTEICVIDGDRGFGNGRLLPAGPLREPLARLADVGFRVRNGGLATDGEVPMQLEGGQVRRLADGEVLPMEAFRGRRVHAVAGIGHPARFFESLRAHGIEVIPHPFPDHHAYAAADLDFGDGLPLLMTEKDAVKCAGFALPQAWAVPVRAGLPAAFFDAVAAQLKQAAQGLA